MIKVRGKVIFLSLYPLTNPVDTTIYAQASHNHHIISPNTFSTKWVPMWFATLPMNMVRTGTIIKIGRFVGDAVGLSLASKTKLSGFDSLHLCQILT